MFPDFIFDSNFSTAIEDILSLIVPYVSVLVPLLSCNVNRLVSWGLPAQ